MTSQSLTSQRNLKLISCQRLLCKSLGIFTIDVNSKNDEKQNLMTSAFISEFKLL